jgi:glycosyltransferase involved in cell wall biosynthesis
MLRIAHLDTGKDLRGGQYQLLLLAQGLRERGHDQVIVCPEGSALDAAARRRGLTVLPLPLHNTVRAAFHLRRFLRARHFQILHAHDGRGQTISWIASMGLPVLCVASRRVTFLPRHRLSHALKYRYTCHAVIAVSQFIQKLLIQSGIPATKIEVIYDGIDFPESLPGTEEKSSIRKSFQLDDRHFVIGHAGAFTGEKGQEIAIQAFQLLERILPNARLLLAGDGPLFEALKRKYTIAEPQGKIRFVGYLDNLSRFMNCLDLFIMPSLAEGLGSSALIAMAHGVPVIASRVGGLPEIVEEQTTGWLVEPGSPGALAERIISIASDKTRLQRAGLHARETARRFTTKVMTDKIEALYCRLMERPMPAG